MASVAEAIEQAAASPKRVDEGLWWDSFPSFLSLLQQRPSPPLLEKLRKQHGCLLNLLSTFKLPNSNSRSAINCPRIIIGDRNIEIKTELKNLVVQLSSRLALDEVQAYILVSRSLEEDTPLLKYEFPSLFKKIAMQYFLERQCLLKCTHQVLVHSLSFESGSPEHDAIIKEVKELLNFGLEDKLLAIIKELLSSEKPSSLDLQYVDMWAEETLIEENLILDILFLLYYKPFCICTVDRFEKLLSIFKEIVTGCSNIGKLAVTQVAQKYAQVVKYQVILIVIEALNFENLLHMVYEGVPFSQGSHAFSLGDLQKIDNLISDITSSESPEVGPIVFAWAIFICLVSMLTETENQTRTEINHSAYIRQAYESGAPNTILVMLQSKIFEDLNDQVAGYKSVLKTLISAFIAAYDFANQMDDNIVKFLLDMLCEIFSGQESLCFEFWDRESVIDGPIRSLLFTFRDNFPYEALPLIRLLASLCEGTWPAECVFDFLYRMSKITCLFQRRGLSHVNNDLQRVQAHISLQVPGASGLVIPSGTFGCVMKKVDEDVILVRWESLHPGILVVLFRMMRDFSCNQEYEELVGSLGLLNQMLMSNKALTVKLMELDSSLVVRTARSYGFLEKTLEVDTIKIICNLINNAVCVSNGSKVVALCTTILCKLFDCFPIEFASQIFSTRLFQSHTNMSNCDGWLLPEPFARLLSLDGDHNGGSYVFTISILDFFKTIIMKGVEIDSLFTLVIYTMRYILVNYGSWKYKFKHEPWELLSKVFNLMHVCIGSRLNKHLIKLKHILMEILLFDTTIQNIILHVLCVKAEFLEELYTSHFVTPKEMEWRQQAIYSALNLVGFVLLDVTFGDFSKDFPAPPALEQTLLHSTTPLPFVISTISLLGFFHNPALQLAAAKVLSSLCFVARKTHSHAVSIASYVSSSKQRNNLNLVIFRLLCEENASSNLELFSATLDLATSAALYQPTFLEIMLFSQGKSVESATIQNNKTSGLFASSIKLEETKTGNGVNVLWTYIQNSEDFMKRKPYILSQILHFLKIHWQGGAECLHILDKLYNQDMFWKCISSCISKFSFSKITTDEALSEAFQYNCQCSALHILANEIFLQSHFVQAEKILTKSVASSSNNINNCTTGGDTKYKMLKSTGSSGALNFLLECNETSVIRRILKSYASCLYNKEVLHNAKATGCAFVVALIGKDLVGDNRGMSLSLIKKIQLASKDLFEHPAFVELLEQYSTRGYSSERGLHALIVNDLYYHLQGELEGRQIPPGSFQKVSDYLIKLLKLDSILQSSIHVRSQDLHPLYGDDYIYDTKSLEAELGMEWWPHSDENVPTVAAQKMLQVLKYANIAFCVADAQKNALKAWMTLLTLTIFDKNTGTDVETVMPDSILSEKSIELCIQDLCDYLHASMQLLGPFGDPTNYMPNFIVLQAQILLIFVWWMFGHITSRKSGIEAWPLCSRVIRTVIINLRVLLDTKPFFYDGIENIVRCLLAVLLISLELINPRNIGHNASQQSKSDMQNLVDAFADVSLMSLEFLPVLCNCVENDKFCNLSLAITDVLLKGFLAPHAWLPVLQKHFPTQLVICQIQHDKWQESAPIILNFCLSLARVRGGAEMLQSAGFFSCLSTFNQFVRNEASLGSGQTEGPFSLWNKWGLSDRLWGLGLAVITAMVMSVGENDIGVAVLRNALTYYISEKGYILSATKAPDNLTDALGRKAMRNRMPQTSLIALENTEHAIFLMSQLAKNKVTRPDMMQFVDSEMRENIIHLLSFISKEAYLCSGDVPYKCILSQCSHLQKEEIAALLNPSIINCNSGWFSVAARGCVTKNRQFLPSQQALSDAVKSIVPLSFTKGTAELDTIPPFCTEYSDMISLHVYRITLLILNFLCMQAQAAMRRLEEAGSVDLLHFPELPVPEILHGLQDQAFNIVRELCSSRKDPLEPEVQSVCLLLLKVMEQSLYLELCVARICGINPVSNHLDDFSKEYNKLISDVQEKASLEAPMKSLKRVAMLLYPTLV